MAVHGPVPKGYGQKSACRRCEPWPWNRQGRRLAPRRFQAMAGRHSEGVSRQQEQDKCRAIKAPGLCTNTCLQLRSTRLTLLLRGKRIKAIYCFPRTAQVPKVAPAYMAILGTPDAPMPKAQKQ
jgi:hypothetical protein